jgi:hypothetical protein
VAEQKSWRLLIGTDRASGNVVSLAQGRGDRFYGLQAANVASPSNASVQARGRRASGSRLWRQ